jgi:hypothetical protein
MDFLIVYNPQFVDYVIDLIFAGIEGFNFGLR